MSWWQLASILREAVANKQAEQAQGPIACPNDGEPLMTGPDGQKYCPFDGWRPDGTWP